MSVPINVWFPWEKMCGTFDGGFTLGLVRGQLLESAFASQPVECFVETPDRVFGRRRNVRSNVENMIYGGVDTVVWESSGGKGLLQGP